jgi:regulator of sirC expression with transglutaminase-like and TPR domain
MYKETGPQLATHRQGYALTLRNAFLPIITNVEILVEYIDYIVKFLLKVEIAEPEKTAFATERLGKCVSSALNIRPQQEWKFVGCILYAVREDII